MQAAQQNAARNNGITPGYVAWGDIPATQNEVSTTDNSGEAGNVSLNPMNRNSPAGMSFELMNSIDIRVPSANRDIMDSCSF